MNKIYLSIMIVCLAAVSVGAAAIPKLKLKQLGGKTVNVSALVGKKIIVLNFWASWCSACEEEIPALAALKASPGADKAVFYGINVGENDALIRYFLEKNNYPFPVLTDSNRKASRKFNLTSVPTTIIISKEGKIIYQASSPPQNYLFK